MKKFIYILSLISTQLSFGQVVITRDNTNLSVSTSVGLDVRSSNQGVAFPENNISSLTDLSAYNGVEPKGGSLIFSNNPTKDAGGNVISESLYGYFYWDSDNHKWVKLLDSTSFNTEFDSSLPLFFSNFDTTNQTSVGVELSADSSWPTSNTAGATYSSMIAANHDLNSTLNTSYWTVLGAGFQPTFNFSKGTKALFKVNAMMTKAGGGAYDFAVAMGVFLNDKLVATRVYPFNNTTVDSNCSRGKMTLLASVDNLVANTSYNVKIGFRIIGNNFYQRSTNSPAGSVNNLNGSMIFVGKAVTTTNPPNSGCSGVSAFESPINLTIFGVSK